jgi:hypothetical protein
MNENENGGQTGRRFRLTGSKSAGPIKRLLEREIAAIVLIDDRPIVGDEAVFPSERVLN